MDNDPQTTTNCKGEPEQERQNRRQFFNGLGKWSLAIIAAVAALREGIDDVQSRIDSRFGAQSDDSGDLRQQIALHGNTPHANVPPLHFNKHTNTHGNINISQLLE